MAIPLQISFKGNRADCSFLESTLGLKMANSFESAFREIRLDATELNYCLALNWLDSHT